jgi:hypothetical protein
MKQSFHIASRHDRSRLDQQSDDPNTQIPPIVTKNTKKNKIENYVFYYSNVDMRAYFDDGTIITCPRCAFTKKMLRIFKVTFQTSQYKHMNLKMMELAN